MEKSNKKQKLNNSQEVRQLLKRCFKNHHLYSQIPFEIWKEIVNRTTLKSIERVAQTCRPFKKLVAVLRTNNFLFAKRCRKEDQIKMAKKYLQECVEDGNLEAMYHLACAYWDGGGWGFGQDKHSALTLFQKLEDTGLYVRPFLRYSPSINDEFEKSLLASGDPFTLGEYYRIYKQNHKTANSLYEIAAKNGNEFAQLQLSNYFLAVSKHIFGGNYDDENDEGFKLAKYWLLKSANQGNALAQFQYGLFMNMDDFWISKAARQGNQIAASLIDLRPE